MTRGERVVAAARALIGTRFRLHGRDSAHGLDCVGLAVVALRAGGFDGAVPDGYAPGGQPAEELIAAIRRAGLIDGRGDDGEMLLLSVGRARHHLAISVPGDGIVHADAGLRRVVERPGPVEWPVAGRFRLADHNGKD